MKTHVVKLIDPNSPAGTNMPIKRNNLYRIVLTKATKLDFNLQVLDWDDEESEIEYPEVPLNLPKNVQDSLNRQLLVYDLFTEYSVKSYNLEDRTIEFELDNYYPEEYPINQFYTWKNLNTAGLCGNTEKSYIYNGEEPYKIPTLGQMMLLVPLYTEPSKVDGSFNFPIFNQNSSAIMNEKPFEETVYLQNTDDFYFQQITDFSDENMAFKGISQLIMSKYSENLYTTLSTDSAYSQLCSKQYAYSSFLRRPVYGIRFKGTNQCAAYKWQPGLTDERNGAYASIKIKALPNKGDGIDVYDIADNKSFWKEGTYIEVKIPVTGDYFFDSKALANGTTAYMFTSTKSSSNASYYMTFNTSTVYINKNATISIGFPLRLVRVKVK